MKRLLLLLVLVALVFGQITEPKLVTQLNSTVTQGGSISADNGDILSLTMNLTVPQSTDYQTIISENGLVTNSEGNKLTSISQINPPNPFNYSFETTVVTNQRITESLPETYSVPTDLIWYTRPSATAQSDNPAIRELAEWITANSTSEFEKIARLTGWVHNYIEYDLDLVGQRKDALWILENQKGVCVEYSNLFSALARSLGYPTRFVLGQAYGDFGWLGHAWNEVYLGEWVPVDATWLEAGHLDATHIEFSKSVEPEANNQVIAQVTNLASINWNKPEFAGESGGTLVDVSDLVIMPEEEDYSLKAVSPELGFGGQTLVTFSIRGEDYRIIDLRLVPCKSDMDILSVSDPTKTLVLEPGKMAYASWVVKSSNNLKSSVIYTCPVTLNSRYLKESSIPISVKKSSGINGFTASLSDSLAAFGETVSVFVKASPGEKLTVITDDYMESRLASPGTTQFTFTPTHAGINNVFVATESGGVAPLSFTVTKEPSIFIKQVEIPLYLFVGQESSFDVFIENSFDNPETVSVFASIDHSEQLSRFSVSGTAELEFTLTPNSPGEQVLKITLSGDGISDEKSLPIFVYDQPTITMEEPILEVYNDDRVLTTFKFNPSDSVNQTVVSFAGQSQQLNGTEAKFLVTPGIHTLLIEWYDLKGVQHTNSTWVNTVPKPLGIDIFEKYAFLWASIIAIILFFGFYSFSKMVQKLRH